MSKKWCPNTYHYNYKLIYLNWIDQFRTEPEPQLIALQKDKQIIDAWQI